MLNAHVDDGGDVYPTVRVVEGKFAVYFENNLSKKRFRTIVSKVGKVVEVKILGNY